MENDFKIKVLSDEGYFYSIKISELERLNKLKNLGIVGGKKTTDKITGDIKRAVSKVLIQ